MTDFLHDWQKKSIYSATVAPKSISGATIDDNITGKVSVTLISDTKR